MRDCQDIDFFYHGNALLPTGSRYISHHDSELKYHTVLKDEIIFNPSYHFYYRGVKFAAPTVLRAMKSNRAEHPKDIQDIQLITSITP